ncbi:hypothetical protein CDL15_Pgr016320 [Punica granatum]|uniref:RNase H type-1 domain-containing protein n=1 Tax=Punica granatum TaxID=22663 RepID=A0A218W725_PUNGR|nr:hypothetical protein CDL15_Pgr016320 [Punica granatum]
MVDLWTLYVDGATNKYGTGVGFVLICPNKLVTEYSLSFKFQATNNVAAEYEVLITGLELQKQMGAEKLDVYSDSMLMVSQVNGKYADRDESLFKYLEKVKKMMGAFKEICVRQVLEPITCTLTCWQSWQVRDQP